MLSRTLYIHCLEQCHELISAPLHYCTRTLLYTLSTRVMSRSHQCFSLHTYMYVLLYTYVVTNPLHILSRAMSRTHICYSTSQTYATVYTLDSNNVTNYHTFCLEQCHEPICVTLHHKHMLLYTRPTRIMSRTHYTFYFEQCHEPICVTLQHKRTLLYTHSTRVMSRTHKCFSRHTYSWVMLYACVVTNSIHTLSRTISRSHECYSTHTCYCIHTLSRTLYMHCLEQCHKLD